MPAYRYFTDQDLQASSPTLILSGEEHHHLSKVMRTKVGDTVEIVNGNGQLATGRVTQVHKESSAIEILDLKNFPPPNHRVILAQAIPRANRIDIIVEKGTELGADEFWWFPGELSEKKTLSAQQTSRMGKQAIAALKQSGRVFLPKIEVIGPIRLWEDLPGRAFFGDVSPDAPLFKEVWQPLTDAQPLIFVVGPEGGLTPDEEAALRAMGVQGVALHPNILRTDTAPLVALSLIQHWLY